MPLSLRFPSVICSRRPFAVLLALLSASASAPAQIAVGSTGNTQIATLTVTVAGTLGSINVVTQGYSTLDFQTAQGGTCTVGQIYSPGATCTVDYTFAPQAAGTRAGAVVLAGTGSTGALATTFISGVGMGAMTRVLPGYTQAIAGAQNLACDPSIMPGCGDGTSGGARLSAPGKIAADAAHNLYLIQSADHRVRVVDTSSGVINAFAGVSSTCSLVTGACPNVPTCTSFAAVCGDGGPALAAYFVEPSGLAVDGAGNVYIADEDSNRVRKVSALTGIITTVAGTGTTCSPSTAACGDGGLSTAAGAAFSGAAGLAVDGAGNLFIADSRGHRIRKVSAATGLLTTVAGTGVACASSTSICGDGGLATAANLNQPADVKLDSAGNLYIADAGDNRIRMVSAATGLISTIAGSGNACTPSSTQTCGDGGSATASAAGFTNLFSLAVDAASNVYFQDQTTLRMVTAASGILSTVQAGTNPNVPGSGTLITSPFGVALDGIGNLYYSDFNTSQVGEITSATGFAFGQVPIDTPPALGIFTWTNTGNQPLNFSALSLSPSVFNLDAATTTCSPSASVKAGTACAVGIDFPVSTPNGGSATLTATNNALAPVGPVQTIAISGGTRSALGTTADTITLPVPSTVNFPGQFTVAPTDVSGLPTYFTISGPASVSGQTVTVLGAGPIIIHAFTYGNATYAAASIISTVTVPALSGPVGTPTGGTQGTEVTITQAGILGAINVTTQGLTGYDFAYQAGGTCTVGTSYTVGQQCSVDYTFTPKGVGVRSGAVVLTATGASGTQVLATGYLSGLGQGSLVTISPPLITAVAVPASGPQLDVPRKVIVDPAGNLYIANSYSSTVLKLSAADGTLSPVAVFNQPTDLALDGAGNLIIGGSGGLVSLSLVTGQQTLLDPAPYPEAEISLALDQYGNIFFDGGTNDFNGISEYNRATGVTSPMYGGAECEPYSEPNPTTLCGDGSLATDPSVGFNYANGLAFDPAGNLFVTDYFSERVRKISAATGIISTLAGYAGYNGYCTTPASCGDGGPATAAIIFGPWALATDAAGNVYISDVLLGEIREVNAATGIITTLAGGFSSYGFSVDPQGNIYAATYFGDQILKIAAQPKPVVFPNGTAPGTPSAAQTVQLNNVGNFPLTFSTPQTGTNPAFSPAGIFLNAGGTCPMLSGGSSAATLAAGASCTQSVVFKPQSAGLATGSLIFTDQPTAGSATQVVPLQGDTRQAPAITPANAVATPRSTSVNLSATVALTGNILTTGAFTFAVDSLAPAQAACALTATATETCTVAYPLTATSPGTHTITASLAPDANYFASSGTATLTVTDIFAALQLAGFPATSISGLPQTVQVTALDPFGAALPAYTGTVTLTSTDPLATLPAPYTFTAADAGVHLFNVTLNTGGLQAITSTENSIGSTTTQTGLLTTGYVWTVNAAGSLSKDLVSGTALSPSTGFTGGGSPDVGLAFDSASNAWSLSKPNSRLVEFSSSGTPLSSSAGFTGGGLSSPSQLAVDGKGQVWITNPGGTLSLFSNQGVAVSPSTGFTGGSGAAAAYAVPIGVAIDAAGNVWVANSTTNTITQVLGAAAPSAPLGNAVTNNTTGVRP